MRRAVSTGPRIHPGAATTGPRWGWADVRPYWVAVECGWGRAVTTMCVAQPVQEAIPPEFPGRRGRWCCPGVRAGRALPRRRARRGHPPAYAADAYAFVLGCAHRGAAALPPRRKIVAAYLTALADAGGKLASITPAVPRESARPTPRLGTPAPPSTPGCEQCRADPPRRRHPRGAHCWRRSWPHAGSVSKPMVLGFGITPGRSTPPVRCCFTWGCSANPR